MPLSYFAKRSRRIAEVLLPRGPEPDLPTATGTFRIPVKPVRSELDTLVDACYAPIASVVPARYQQNLPSYLTTQLGAWQPHSGLAAGVLVAAAAEGQSAFYREAKLLGQESVAYRHTVQHDEAHLVAAGQAAVCREATRALPVNPLYPPHAEIMEAFLETRLLKYGLSNPSA